MEVYAVLKNSNDLGVSLLRDDYTGFPEIPGVYPVAPFFDNEIIKLTDDETDLDDEYRIAFEYNNSLERGYIHHTLVKKYFYSEDEAIDYRETLIAKSKVEDSTTSSTTQQNSTQGNNMTTPISQTATNLMHQNKDNATAVARVTAGKAINKKLLDLVKPKLPLMVRGFADHELAPLLIANGVAFAIKQYTDNAKANEAADMMLEAAAFQTAEAFNIDDIIEDLLDGIKMPGVLSFNIATAKTAELKAFAAEQGIDLSGCNNNDERKAAITAAMS